MSEATRAAMDAAIEAHLADEDGGMLTGYVLKMEGRTIEGIEGGYTKSRWEVPSTQSVTSTMGLTHALHLDVENWYMRRGEEGDA